MVVNVAETSGQQYRPQQQFGALGKPLNRRKLIMCFDGGSCMLEMFVHDALKKFGTSPQTPTTKEARDKEIKIQGAISVRLTRKPRLRSRSPE
jgi:hypothetical protein